MRLCDTRPPRFSRHSLLSLFIPSSKAQSCSSKLSKGVCSHFSGILLCVLCNFLLCQKRLALYPPPSKPCIIVSFSLTLFMGCHPVFEALLFIFLKQNGDHSWQASHELSISITAVLWLLLNSSPHTGDVIWLWLGNMVRERESIGRDLGISDQKSLCESLKTHTFTSKQITDFSFGSHASFWSCITAASWVVLQYEKNIINWNGLHYVYKGL